jgi:aspartate aminotransferase-like enzyme
VPARARLRLVSQRALATPAQNPEGRYYFDWGKNRQGQRKGNARSRPPCRSSSAFDIALDMIRDRGARDVFARHALLARATRAGVAAHRARASIGDPDERSTVVTAVELPRRSTATRSLARCASSASRPTAARTR